MVRSLHHHHRYKGRLEPFALANATAVSIIQVHIIQDTDPNTAKICLYCVVSQTGQNIDNPESVQ